MPKLKYSKREEAKRKYIRNKNKKKKDREREKSKKFVQEQKINEDFEALEYNCTHGTFCICQIDDELYDFIYDEDEYDSDKNISGTVPIKKTDTSFFKSCDFVFHRTIKIGKYPICTYDKVTSKVVYNLYQKYGSHMFFYDVYDYSTIYMLLFYFLPLEIVDLIFSYMYIEIKDYSMRELIEIKERLLDMKRNSLFNNCSDIIIDDIKMVDRGMRELRHKDELRQTYNYYWW